jgi:hypothetical protein
MSVSNEIEKVKEVIRSIEDPSTATALRHICKALEEVEKEVQLGGERKTERTRQ